MLLHHQQTLDHPLLLDQLSLRNKLDGHSLFSLNRNFFQGIYGKYFSRSVRIDPRHFRREFTFKNILGHEIICWISNRVLRYLNQTWIYEGLNFDQKLGILLNRQFQDFNRFYLVRNPVSKRLRFHFDEFFPLLPDFFSQIVLML